MDLSNIEKGLNIKTDQWFTPQWILNECGEFDLDPCGDFRWPTAETIYINNGLEQDWFGRVWLNPPYGKETAKWLSRLANHGNGLALVFGRTDTKWFHEIAHKASWILFIKGRVKFIDGESLLEAKNPPGAPSILIAFGKQDKPKIDGIFLNQLGD